MGGLKPGLGCAAIACCLLAACSGESPVPGETVAPPTAPVEVAEETPVDTGAGYTTDAMMVVHEELNGRSVELKVGQVLRVELVSVPTAGYVWALKYRPDFLEFAGEGQRMTDPELQSQPGYTGGNHWMFTDLKAIAPGTGTIRLEEGRPWENDEPPTDVFELTVTVVPAE